MNVQFFVDVPDPPRIGYEEHLMAFASPSHKPVGYRRFMFTVSLPAGHDADQETSVPSPPVEVPDA